MIDIEEFAFIQEVIIMDLDDIDERIKRGPLTRWEEENWPRLEETLFIKRREMESYNHGRI